MGIATHAPLTFTSTLASPPKSTDPKCAYGTPPNPQREPALTRPAVARDTPAPNKRMHTLQQQHRINGSILTKAHSKTTTTNRIPRLKMSGPAVRSRTVSRFTPDNLCDLLLTMRLRNHTYTHSNDPIYCIRHHACTSQAQQRIRDPHVNIPSRCVVSRNSLWKVVQQG